MVECVCVCVHVSMLELFIYACLLRLAHELAAERVKALRRQPSYVTFSRGRFNPSLTVRTHTFRQLGEARVIPVAE